MDATEAGADLASRSQSALSPVLLWVLLAAVAAARRDRRHGPGGAGDGPGLVRVAEPGSGAAAQAARLGKPVLYDFTADWCAPCKLLDKDWADASVAERVNAAFVPVRIMDRMREEGRNAPDIAELQRRYEVSAFPTLVVAAPDGRLIAKHEGYRSTQALVSFLAGVGERLRLGRRPLETPQSSSSSSFPAPVRTETGPFTVATRTSTGPSPTSMRRLSSSQVLRAEPQASPRHWNGERPADSTTAADP